MSVDRWDTFMLGLAFAETMNGRFAEATIFLACAALGVFISWRERQHLAHFDRRSRPALRTSDGGKDG